MRNSIWMVLAVLSTLTTSVAAAQTPAAREDASAEAPAEHEPAVTFEVQGRIGGASLWARAEDPAGLPAIESGNAGAMLVGASLSVRHAGSGLGVTGGYTHGFTGVRTQYGTHAFDARLSERFTFFRRSRLELSVLFEAGVVFLDGGAQFRCPIEWWSGGSVPSTCETRDVSVGGIGGIGAVGFQVRFGAFLGGVEIDYRHIEGSRGVATEDQLALLLRAGVAFDL